MPLNVPLMLFHVPSTIFEDLQTFDDVPLMYSKALLGFNH
jgi:hypothetical protein